MIGYYTFVLFVTRFSALYNQHYYSYIAAFCRSEMAGSMSASWGRRPVDPVLQICLGHEHINELYQFCYIDCKVYTVAKGRVKSLTTEALPRPLPCCLALPPGVELRQ